VSYCPRCGYKHDQPVGADWQCVGDSAAEIAGLKLSVSVFEEEFNDDSWDVDKVERAQEFLDRWNKAMEAGR